MSIHSLQRFSVLVLRVCSCIVLASVSSAYAQLYPKLTPGFEVPDCGIPCHAQVGALDGNTAVVVSTLSHAVEIYTHAADGSWSLSTALLDPDIAPPPPDEESPSNPYENSNFGSAVALDKGVLLVASSARETGGAQTVHKVHVFRRVAQQWMLRQSMVVSPAPGADAFFINSLALDGNTALIGTVTWTEANGAFDERGAVHVLRKMAGGIFKRVAKVSPADALNTNFGAALDVRGDTFVVGADLRNEARGAAYIYQRGKRGWVLQQTLSVPGQLPRSVFGSAIAISSDTLAIGAPAPREPANKLEGKVFIYKKAAHRWQLRQTLVSPLETVPEITAPIATLGSALDVSGRRLIVTSDFPFNEPGTPLPAAFLFERRAGRWTAVAEFGGNSPGEIRVSGSTALLIEQTRFGGVPSIYKLPRLKSSADVAEGDAQ